MESWSNTRSSRGTNFKRPSSRTVFTSGGAHVGGSSCVAETGKGNLSFSLILIHVWQERAIRKCQIGIHTWLRLDFERNQVAFPLSASLVIDRHWLVPPITREGIGSDQGHGLVVG